MRRISFNDATSRYELHDGDRPVATWAMAQVINDPFFWEQAALWLANGDLTAMTILEKGDW